MSTFFAAFPDTVKAELMVRHLLNDGMEFDDISLVSSTIVNIEGAGKPNTGDATFFVNREDDPPHDLVDESSPGADYEATELSQIGGGISTSDRGTNVDSVDQMDESQEAADDQTWPRSDTSTASHEMDDLNRAVNTGFPTPVTPLDNDFPQDTEPDRPLESVTVPGVGIVIGGGDLATAAFDWRGENGKPNTSAIQAYLKDEGVSAESASQLIDQYGKGGAILAVALLPEINEQALDEVASKYGAATTGWFGAPRY